ncbi:hypothetical protein ACFOQM_18080 [Paenibacillus sp. GCM10012307]|uniref:DUF5668 domain-containing protein n=1 Tax=Paenibacillus roseus TaxID=2798579 RepID=A0A934JA91_9BACL|nr:hypothetical protein [Paenibacillus roseus]MBJ6363133.1 hypothetical protein [Paenibacillus roseus]
MSKNQYSVGILMLIAGIVILFGKLGVFSFIGSVFWPLFVLIPGILLHVLYFGRIIPAVALIPGGMLSTYALLFIYCNAFGWDQLQFLWPFFIFGVAVGLYEYYTFSYSRQRRIQVVAFLLAGITAASFAMMLLWSWGIYLVALVLIAAGAWIVFGRRLKWAKW